MNSQAAHAKSHLPAREMPMHMASELAVIGGAQIIEEFTRLAEQEDRAFVEAPAWNGNDIIARENTQHLYFTIPGSSQRRVVFLTSEIEGYGLGDKRSVTDCRRAAQPAAGIVRIALEA